eukprot:jgi/Mesvir1/2070/Mv02323-RA.1
MGTKEVLFSTRSLTMGCPDTARYDSAEDVHTRMPALLAGGPRVVKRNRGNDGQGMWKVEALASSSTTPSDLLGAAPSGAASGLEGAALDRPMVRVLDATGETPEVLPLDALLSRISHYFRDYGSCVIDQPFQARLTYGVVRCYMAGDQCAGFGTQKVKAGSSNRSQTAPNSRRACTRATRAPVSSSCDGSWRRDGRPRCASCLASRGTTCP